MTNENIKNALLEIGTEEIPSLYIEPALKQIDEFAAKALSAAGLKYASLKTYATPRRLVLFIENLDEKSPGGTEEILGPSLKAAKDTEGNFTHAAVGFADKNGIKPEKLSIKTTEKGEYLCFVKKIIGEKTEKILPVFFLEIIKNISFPKTMVWEESMFRFARPIRSITALYGKKIINFKIADVKSSNRTIGLHAADNGKIVIDLPENYLLKMKNKSVIADQNERKEEIKKSIDYAVKDVGSVIADEALIDEINYLVEYPSAVLCDFDKKYLDLPQEVLTVCMKKSQKCFAINDKDGNFSNHFIGVRNGISRNLDIVKEGYEKVVAARLTDAEFFYHNDLRKGLRENFEKLKGVVFHKEMGTVYEKIERIKRITSLLNHEFNIGIDDNMLDKAVMFSKADLVSEMVFEYPELQGVMGKIYALKLGENAEIAHAVEQHYWPLSSFGKLPENKIAVLISLADKIDTLAANFSIGIEPSGSADPYGLRRAGIGVIRMITENFPQYDLTDILEKTFNYLPENVKSNPKYKNAPERLGRFFRQRIENILESEGYAADEVKAVVNALEHEKMKKLGTLRPKLDALINVKCKEDFISISSVFKRINNIISQAKKQNTAIAEDINETLMKESAELELYNAGKSAQSEVEDYLSKAQYDKIFDKVLELKPLIDNFFEKVMVMDKDEKIKKNRIALLNKVKNIFINFVDFSALQN
ncbi:MAG: glycine--tRNA ligase subunit beta [Endomicrobium sp.]|jgi:glycyl-tRNA synthetase beta chain|nr:glycine--tRNA ligase subunit beta [Endomicrobium sp.]